MGVTVTKVDENTSGHYKVTRYKFTRDAGAEMAAAHKHSEPAAFIVITKMDGTYVDTRNETPSGLTYSVSGEITSILTTDALLNASESIYVDVYVGPVLNA